MSFAFLRREDILIKLSSYFLSQISKGEILFVGEGNLSFALGVAEIPHISASRITATTYEEESDISEVARDNALALRRAGAEVQHGIDATCLENSFPYRRFDTIAFQFPNVGSRVAVEGRNPNFIMIRDFLKSAAHCLDRQGKVMITAVDSPYYRGSFQFDEAANVAGFKKPEVYSFDPLKLRGYSHTNTNNEESAIDDQEKFCTWVFSLKDRV